MAFGRTLSRACKAALNHRRSHVAKKTGEAFVRPSRCGRSSSSPCNKKGVFGGCRNAGSAGGVMGIPNGFGLRASTFVCESLFSRGYAQVKGNTKKEDEDDEFDEDEDGEDGEHGGRPLLSDAEKGVAARLWSEVHPLNITNVAPLVKTWKDDDDRLTISGVLYVVFKLRSVNRFRQALSILDWLLEEKPFGALDENLTKLHIMIACEAYNIRRAQEVFDILPPDQRTDSIKCTLIIGYAVRNLLEEAERLLERFKPSNPAPYTALLKLYFRIGQYAKVAPLYKQIKAAGMEPSVATFALLLKDKDKIDEIEGLEQDVEAALNKSGAYDDPSKMKQSTAGNVLCVFAYLGKAADAKRIWASIKKEDFIRVSSYVNAIDAFGELRDLKMAEKVADEMVDTKKSHVRLSTALIRLYSRLGMMDRAEEVLEDMSERGVKPVFTVYNHLMMGYLANKKPEKALSTLKKAVKINKLKATYVSIVNMLPVFAQRKDVDGAEELVLKYKGKTDIQMYKELVKVYLSAKKKPVEEFEARMIIKDITPDEEMKELMTKLQKLPG